MRALDLLSEAELRIAEAELRKTAPHLTLEAIAGDAQAIYGLLRQARGEPLSDMPFCSIRFKTAA